MRRLSRALKKKQKKKNIVYLLSYCTAWYTFLGNNHYCEHNQSQVYRSDAIWHFINSQRLWHIHYIYHLCCHLMIDFLCHSQYKIQYNYVLSKGCHMYLMFCFLKVSSILSTLPIEISIGDYVFNEIVVLFIHC